MSEQSAILERGLKILAIVALAAIMNGGANAGETLYNGIELPDQWPPKNTWNKDIPPLRNGLKALCQTSKQQQHSNSANICNSNPQVSGGNR